MKNESVPEAVIPSNIMSYLKVKFPNNKVIKIEQERKKYEIKLDHGIEIEFDKNGKLIKID